MADVREVNLDNIVIIVNDVIKDYCENRNIDINDIPPQIWNDIIDEIYITVFKDNNTLLRCVPKQGLNKYDINKLEYIYDNVYKRICNQHCMEISIKGFSDMTGFNKQCLYNWDNSSNENNYFREKILLDNEQSLEAMLHDRRINPMKVLPSLNKKHGWNLPGVSRERAKLPTLSVDDLPRLIANNGTFESLEDSESINKDDTNG